MHDRRVGVRMGWFVWGLVAVLAVVAASCTTGGGGGGGSIPAGPTATIAVGGETIQVSGPSESVVTVVSSVAGSLPVTPAGLVFPFGALHLEVHNVAVGAVTHIAVTLQTPVDTFRKTIGGAWDPFTLNGTTGGTLSADGKTIDLDIADGGRGDDDGVANGIIIDDLAGTNATALTITSNDIPLVLYGQPYSHQLEAAGAAGPVTWSVLSGSLPTGITLDAAGLLSGTATATGGSPLRVEATDGTTTVTKLLLVAVVSGDSGGATSNNAVLPDGTRIFFGTFPNPCSAPGCAASPARYFSNGTVSPISTISVNSFRTLQGSYSFVNPAGTRAILTVPPTTPNGPSTGPVEVVDGETGAPVTTLESSPTFTVGSTSFSPNGAYAVLSDTTGSTRVLETTTWSVVRTFTTGAAYTQLIWSPDSTEIAAGNGSGPVTVTSVTTPASDRTLTIAGQSYCRAADWSATNRLALMCSGGVVTASAVDGSDIRVVAGTTCTALPCVQTTAAVFSPSGTHLAIGEATFTSYSNPPVFSSAELVVAPDVASAPVTPVVTVGAASFVMPINWR